jgi:hypothetical protein
MTSFYSIIQITGDPVADERINLGLIAFGEQERSLRFTEDINRAATFLGSHFNARHVGGLIDSIREDLDSVLNDDDPLQQIRDLAAQWQRTVRITAPRASLLSMEELMSTLAPRALPTGWGAEPRQRARDRRAAVKLARNKLKSALGHAHSPLKVKNNVPVQGAHQIHRLDLGLANGVVRLGVTGLSFEGDFSPDRMREMGSLKWIVDDVRTQDKSFRICVIVLSPEQSDSTIDEDLAVLRSLGAELILEPEVDQWATAAVAAM